MAIKKGKSREVREGYGVVSVNVDFKMHQLIAIHQLISGLKACVDPKNQPKDVVIPSYLHQGMVDMLSYIVGDIKSPFDKCIWEADTDESVEDKPKHGLDRDDI